MIKPKALRSDCRKLGDLVLSQDLNLPLKAVNLGNWLVVEGWMKPELFYDIPMNDLLDGTQVQFKSPSLKNYLSATNSGGSTILANRAEASAWETFKLWRIDENHFNFRVSNKMFMGLSHMGTNRIVAMRDARNETEIFQIVRKDGDPNRVRIKASNGKFLQAISAETVVTADYGGSLGWDDSNPSVFDMTIVHSLDGEYQITNGYGPDKAPQVMQNHWDTYITEEDFRFMKSSGLDAVRIPVGWWIAYGSTPPKPFVGGSFQALKNAFTWAKNTGMKVIIDLHAVEHSQNGDAHSGTRDGSQEPWGDEYIDKTVEVINFLAERFANDPALAAIELLNEPRVSYVNLSNLIKYYNAGYEAVRKYNPNAFVILSNRLGISDQRELFQFAQSLNNVVIDVHYYSVFDHDTFSQKTAEENIQYIYEQRRSQLSKLQTSHGKPFIFVGEWVAEFIYNGHDKSDTEYQRFAAAQIEVYGYASFGWAYWSYNCIQGHWSLKNMIDKGIINLLN